MFLRLVWIYSTVSIFPLQLVIGNTSTNISCTCTIVYILYHYKYDSKIIFTDHHSLLKNTLIYFLRKAIYTEIISKQDTIMISYKIMLCISRGEAVSWNVLSALYPLYLDEVLFFNLPTCIFLYTNIIPSWSPVYVSNLLSTRSNLVCLCVL